MMLIRFSSHAQTQDFFSNFNGKPFNSFEKEICHVVWIKSILLDQDLGDFVSVFPYTLLLTHTPTSLPESQIQASLNAVAAANVVEMPSCPVCLDRLDASVTGLFTSVCHHTFHCNCIMKWDGSSCPV